MLKCLPYVSGMNPFASAVDKPGSPPASMSSPDYSYTDHIKNPSELDMGPGSGSLDAIVGNLNGMVDYIQVMLPGGGGAIQGCKENQLGCTLGNSYFLKTAQKCASSGGSVTRSVYIDNVAPASPLGNGLIPGMIHNVAELNPFAILSAFLSGPAPPCRSVTLETGNFPDWKYQTAFLTDTDITTLDPCKFKDRRNPVTGNSKSAEQCSASGSPPPTEGFSLMDPDAAPSRDKMVSLYHGAIALLGLYIALKLVEKEHKR